MADSQIAAPHPEDQAPPPHYRLPLFQLPMFNLFQPFARPLFSASSQLRVRFVNLGGLSMEIQTLILHPGPSLAPTARPEGEARGECAAGVRKSRERQEGRARQGVGRERTFPVSSANCTVMTLCYYQKFILENSQLSQQTHTCFTAMAWHLRQMSNFFS